MRKTLTKIVTILVILWGNVVLANELSSDEGQIAQLITPHPEHFMGLIAYDHNYLMETYSNKNFTDKQKMRNDEVKFQISLGLPIWQGILGQNSVLAGSYTQQSWFQLTNRRQSSPFRETNYEPQLFVGWKTAYDLPFGWKLDELETGLNHQSNGRSNQGLKSRSWNRLYTRLALSNGNWMVELKPWWRIPENNRSNDNPDISRYRGYFDLTVGYRYHAHHFKLKGHFNPRYGNGGLEVTYSYPLTKYIRLYAQYFGGYGESLIDYNRNIQRVGVGIALNNLF